MAETVAETIGASGAASYRLIGHSMGGKVAMVLARWAEDGDLRLTGLDGLILLAASPPSPEPLPDAKRREMAGWFTGDESSQLREAEQYINGNSARPLPAETRHLAVDDVLRASRKAWLAWLEVGSREDWSDRIGTLLTPAIIVGGTEDEDLGIEAQSRLSLPHFRDARLAPLKGAGHLLPMERPDDIATLMAEFVP